MFLSLMDVRACSTAALPIFSTNSFSLSPLLLILGMSSPRPGDDDQHGQHGQGLVQLLHYRLSFA